MGAKAFAVGLLALVLAAYAPSGVAQDPSVSASVSISIPDPGVAVHPGTTSVFGFRVEYRWGPGGVSQEPIELTVSLVESPDWADVTFSPDRFTVDLNPRETRLMNGSKQFSGSVNVTAAGLAPAFLRQNVTLMVEATASGNLRQPPPQRSTLPLQTDFAGTVRLEAEPLIARGGASHLIPVRVTNAANGPVQVVFTTTSLLPLARVETPAPVILGHPESPGDHPAETLVHVRVDLPWTQTQKGTVTLTASATNLDNSQRNPILEDVAIEIESAAAVPGAGGFAAIITLAAVALGLAGRRGG